MNCEPRRGQRCVPRAGRARTPGRRPASRPGYAQANLVILPKDWAFDFLLFCHRNPKPCPLLDVTEPGDAEAKHAAPGGDLRTDLPAYRVWHHGELIEEPTDIVRHWAR